MNYVFLILDVSHMFTPPTPPRHKAAVHVCPRHGRERRKVMENKPVKPVRSIQPQAVKPVRQVREQVEVKEKPVSVTLVRKIVQLNQNSPPKRRCPRALGFNMFSVLCFLLKRGIQFLNCEVSR